MFDSIVTFFGNIRFADILDILIVSVFLYIFFYWLRENASKRILSTALFFLVVYVIARIFDLYLTEILIKVLIAIIVLTSIIVFQSDIRRLIDIIGHWILFEKKIFDSSSPTVDIISQAVMKMADNRTGALIAIKGKEEWDRGVHGGVTLNGIISQPLLFSIFNINSPGHDGAVLLEGEKIKKFAAHLELSKNLSQLGQGGTRHAAALGLSEMCDAFVIVVSEERGTVSIASGGKLMRVTSGSELKNRLGRFWEKNYVDGGTSAASWWKKKRIATASLSLLISAVLWFVFAYQSEVVYRTIMAPVEFRNISTELGIKDPVPLEARVTLAGSEQAFRLLDPSAVVISIDLSKLTPGANTLIISEDNLNIPSQINLYDVEPPTFKLNVQALKTVQVPVEVRTTGKLPADFKSYKINTDPENVYLIIAENSSAPKNVSTEPVDLSSLTGSTKLTRRFIPPANSRLSPDQKPEINISITLEPK
jgi:diadenylate cyclase